MADTTKEFYDNVGNAAVDETTDAVGDNVRREIRDGVNSIFGR